MVLTSSNDNNYNKIKVQFYIFSSLHDIMDYLFS